MTLRFSVDSKEILLKQVENFKDVEKYLKEERDVRTTCELIISGNFSELNRLREISVNLENICSLASCNYVTSMYENIYKNDELCKTTYYPLKTYPFTNETPLIDTRIHYIEEFKKYLELAYPQYITLKNDLGLSYVIEFFTSTKVYNIIQISYLLSTTTLECLHNYFKKWQKLPPINNLEQKTRRILDYYNIPYQTSDLNFRIIRNNITHEGDFPLGVDGYNELIKLRNLLDRILLTILGYNGNPYHNVITNTKEIL